MATRALKMQSRSVVIWWQKKHLLSGKCGLSLGLPMSHVIIGGAGESLGEDSKSSGRTGTQ